MWFGSEKEEFNILKDSARKKFKSKVVYLAVFLVGMKAVAAAHQCSNGFHKLWFRRSYICLLYFCLCFTRAEVSHRQYLLWQHNLLITALTPLWGRRRQFGISVCCRSRPTAEHESCREKREKQFGKSAIGGLSVFQKYSLIQPHYFRQGDKHCWVQ